MDCNSPNRLKLLKLHTVPVGARVNLQRYSRITHCDFALNKFNPFAVGDDQIFANCRDLRSLCIRGGDGESADLDTVINHQSPCFSIIKELHLGGFHGDKSIDSNQFVQLLSKCPFIEHLKLLNVGIEGIIERAATSGMLSQITRTVRYPLPSRCVIGSSMALEDGLHGILSLEYCGCR